MNDAFDNGLFYLRKALRTLAAEAEKQCELMGDYNVAWEVRDDILSGVRLLETGGKELSDKQAQGIWNIANTLRALDSKLFVSATGRPENFAAMTDSSWNPIREQAETLLASLPNSSFESDD